MSDAPRETPVVFVLLPGCVLLDLAGPAEVLARAGRESGGACRYALSFVAPTAAVETGFGLALGGAGPLPDAVAPGTTLVLVGHSDARGPARAAQEQAEAEVVAWLARVVVPGVRLVTICAGALLAARAGLLRGHRCTTHHELVDELAALAPGAEVVADRLFVVDRERWSSAGVTSGIDLALHLLAEDGGAPLAAAVARALVVYFRRTPADVQLSPWLEGRNHLHPAVHRAQDAVVADPAADWSVERLAAVAGASPRHFSRLFNRHSAMSSTDFVTRVRLALARQWIETSRLDLEAVAEKAGFGSSRQLRRAWQRHVGGAPSAARRSGESALGSAA